MLERSGLLRTGPAPPPPAIEPPPVGRWTVRDAVLENDGEGPIVARVGGCAQFRASASGRSATATAQVMHAARFGEAVDAATTCAPADDGGRPLTALTVRPAALNAPAPGTLPSVMTIR